MIHVPLITPFAEDGSVATAALEELAHEVLADGAGGLVALGTTGEPAGLADEERAEVAAVVGRVCREHGARFTVGVSASGTERAAAALAALETLPVLPDAALVTVPPFTRPGEAGVVAHFRALAAAGPVPLLVYHVPRRTGQPLSAAALRELAALPGIAGVKYAVDVIDAQTVELLGDLPAGFEVLAGDDVLAPALFALGAHGGILASAHLATAQWVRLAARGDGPGGDGTGSGESAGRAATGGAPVPGPGAPRGIPALGHAAPTGGSALGRAAGHAASGGVPGPGHAASAGGSALGRAAGHAASGRGPVLRHAAPGADPALGHAAPDGAVALGHRLSALAAALFREPNPAVIKAVLHAQGRIPTPDVRLPLLPAGREAFEDALGALDGLAGLAGLDGPAASGPARVRLVT
ncbi:dihydrodipicolinate synthase family protein [Actinacidiphila acididurans]|uniref:dihydrodipicolinate synthase family protein n=1 Tax=Actinacidiphila acididurans TaxID=2784346 RepID=UPI001F3FF397|nr:dihydrodipicolinate synthase family protein [Actinacidiphila acididurans]